MIRKLSIGYRYWHMQRHRFGWRQVGGELLCVMDDFGTLVPARGVQREAFATYQQWGGMKVAPDAGSNHRGGRP